MKWNDIRAIICWLCIPVVLTVVAIITDHPSTDANPIPPPTVVISKPATPKSVRHFVFTTSNDESAMWQANDYIGMCVRDGYKIAVVAPVHNENGYTEILVVAEKY